MNRRTAIATAAAATMTLLSGFVAVGAHTGALGIGGSPTPAVAQPAAAPVAAPADAASATNAATAARSTSSSQHERQQENDHAYEGRESDD